MKKEEYFKKIVNLILEENEEKLTKKINTKTFKKLYENPYNIHGEYIGLNFEKVIKLICEGKLYSKKQVKMIFKIPDLFIIFPNKYIIEKFKNIDEKYIIQYVMSKDEFYNYLKFISNTNIKYNNIYYLLKFAFYILNKSQVMELGKNWHMNIDFKYPSNDFCDSRIRDRKFDLNGSYINFLLYVNHLKLNYEECLIFKNFFYDNFRQSYHRFMGLDILEATKGGKIVERSTNVLKRVKLFLKFINEYNFYLKEYPNKYKKILNPELLKKVFKYYLEGISNITNPNVFLNKRKYDLIALILESTEQFNFLKKGYITQNEFKYLENIPYFKLNVVEDNNIFYGDINIGSKKYKITH